MLSFLLSGQARWDVLLEIATPRALPPQHHRRYCGRKWGCLIGEGREGHAGGISGAARGRGGRRGNRDQKSGVPRRTKVKRYPVWVKNTRFRHDNRKRAVLTVLHLYK